MEPCFCDIPVEDLKIHVKKYSRFGLAFDKNLIVNKGGAPVNYIPNKSKVRELIDLTQEQMVGLAKGGDDEHLKKMMDKYLPRYQQTQ